MIISTIFNILFYSFSFVIAMICWVLAKFSSRRAMWHVLKFWGHGVVFLVRWVLWSKIEVHGLHHYKPGTSQLIVAKHQSELDIVMLGYCLWDVTAIAMKELERLPFFGAILKGIDAVTVAVDAGPQGRTQQAVEGALRIKGQNRALVIYPEGELMKLGAKERYRRGVGHIYNAKQVEVVPVAVSLGVIWPQRRWRKNIRQTGAIEFMEPIPPGMEFEEFMTEIEHRIETRTMELIETHASGKMLEDARDRHRRGATNAD